VPPKSESVLAGQDFHRPLMQTDRHPCRPVSIRGTL
jgi:hypothetical protein